jgi:HK97 family phage prohead protease
MTRQVVKTLTAEIDSADAGGFTAIASTPGVDRDGEVLSAGCFNPLPETVPVHLDHRMDAANVIARAWPHYQHSDLVIDAVFSRSAEAQQVRRKVQEGTLSDVSVAFRALEWANVHGVRTLVSGDLLSVDIVSVPSNASARMVSVRGFGVPSRGDFRAEADRTINAARLQLAMMDLREAERFLRTLSRPPSRLRQQTDGAIGQTLGGWWPR